MGGAVTYLIAAAGSSSRIKRKMCWIIQLLARQMPVQVFLKNTTMKLCGGSHAGWDIHGKTLTDNHRDQISRDCLLVERWTETVVIDGDEMGESREQPAMVELLFIAIVLYSGYVTREERKSPPGEMWFGQTPFRYILRAVWRNWADGDQQKTESFHWSRLDLVYFVCPVSSHLLAPRDIIFNCG